MIEVLKKGGKVKDNKEKKSNQKREHKIYNAERTIGKNCFHSALTSYLFYFFLNGNHQW